MAGFRIGLANRLRVMGSWRDADVRETHFPRVLLRSSAVLLVTTGALTFGGCGPPEEPTVAPSDYAAKGASPDPIVGSWRPREYRLAAGETLPVDGRITFLARRDDAEHGEWSVVFFVTGVDGAALRGSAEGGAWSREGDALLLTHQYHLSAGEAVGPLPAAPLAMALRSAAEADRNHREPCEVAVEGDRLTLFFPSGNSMTFDRVESLR